MRARERHREGSVWWGWGRAGRSTGREVLKWWEGEVLDGERRDLPGEGAMRSRSVQGCGTWGHFAGRMVGELLEHPGRCRKQREQHGLAGGSPSGWAVDHCGHCAPLAARGWVPVPSVLLRPAGSRAFPIPARGFGGNM